MNKVLLRHSLRKFAEVCGLGSPELIMLTGRITVNNCDLSIVDLSFLSEMECIRHISLVDCNIYKLPDLSHLPNLETLSVPFNRLTCIPPISFGLRRLCVASNMLDRVPHIPLLKELDISYNRVSRVLTLSPNLNYIDIRGNPIISLGHKNQFSQLVAAYSDIEIPGLFRHPEKAHVWTVKPNE